MLVYDITMRESFEHVGKWIAEIHKNADPNVNCILVGNKCDLADQRAVTHEEGQAIAEKFGLEFLEVSAMDNTNVEKAFMGLATQVVDRIGDDLGKSKAKTVRVDNNSKNSKEGGKSGCC